MYHFPFATAKRKKESLAKMTKILHDIIYVQCLSKTKALRGMTSWPHFVTTSLYNLGF